jgi:phage shock protein C
MTALQRPKKGRIIAGVCAALARRFGWNTNIVRLLFVLSCLLPGPQFVIYVILWVLIPNEPTGTAAAT